MTANPFAGNWNYFKFWVSVLLVGALAFLAVRTLLFGFVFDPGWEFRVGNQTLKLAPEAYVPFIFGILPFVLQFAMARNRPPSHAPFDFVMSFALVAPVVLAVLSWFAVSLGGYSFPFTPYKFLVAAWIVIGCSLDLWLLQFGGLGFDSAPAPAPRVERDPLAPPSPTPYVEEPGSRDVTIRIGVQVNGQNIVLENVEGRELLPRS